MFDNYPAPQGYVPDNITRVLPVAETEEDSLPRKEYDIEGNFVAYSWRYGDTLILEYHVDDYIADECVGATMEFNFLDHYRESVVALTANGSDTVNINITDEISAKLIPGNYFLTCVITKDNLVYASSEYTLLVKEK